ncbi:hypothetical protein AB0F36_33520, partial [Streptomyces sp. NPDC029080]
MATAPRLPVVRRVAVVSAHTGENAPQTASLAAPGPSGTGPTARRSPSNPAANPGSRADTGPARPAAPHAGHAGQAGHAGKAGQAGHEAVRTRPVSRPLTVARRLDLPPRQVSAVRPAAPAAGQAGQGARPDVAVRHRGSRPPLGAPLSRLPETAVPVDPPATGTGTATSTATSTSTGTGTGTARKPTLPVVQSRTEGAGDRPPVRSEGDGRTAPTTARAGEASTREAPAARPGSARGGAGQPSGSRARTGLGAPLAALPPTAGRPSAAPTARTASPGGRSGVQRSPAPPPPAPAPAPAPDAVTQPETSPRQRPQAPLLGPAVGPDTAAAEASAASGGRRSGEVPGTGAPGVLVQRHTGADAVPASGGHPGGPGTPSASGASGAEGPAAPRSGHPGPHAAGPRTPGRPGGTSSGVPQQGRVPLVVARAVTAQRDTASTVTSAAAAPAPTVRLLSARPLGLSTPVVDGISAAARHGGARPVVPARWAREATPSDSARAVRARPGSEPGGGTVQRAPRRTPGAGAPGPALPVGTPAAPVGAVDAPPPVRVVRPVPPGSTQTAPGSRARPPLPVTGPQPPTVQPAPAGLAAQAVPVRAAPVVRAAAPVVQRDVDAAAGGSHGPGPGP